MSSNPSVPAEDTASPSQAPSGTLRASRALAILFALMCGIGVGHAYAGRSRRAFFWVGVFVACAVLSVIVLLWGPPRFSLLTLGLLWLSAWLAPLVDLVRLPKEQLGKPSYVALVCFAFGMYALPFGLAVMTRVFCVEAFKIPSGGMMPTLLVQDHIFVDKLAYRFGSPRRGDIVVFRNPEHPEHDFAQRIVALPGETISFEDGRPLINGWRVPTCRVGSVKMDSGNSGELELEYLDGRPHLTLREETQHFDLGHWTLGEGEYFVLGDNRDNSADSRTWYGGKGSGVPRANLKGRASQIWIGFSGADVDSSRMGIALDSVTLPRAMEALGPELEACAKNVPKETIPPPPK